MIHEVRVSAEVAKLLKEKGFDEPCEYFYRFDSNKIYMGTKFTNAQIGDKFYNAPTQQLVCEWLRQNHNLSVEVYRTAYGWIGCIVAIPSGTDIKFLEDEGDDPASGAYTTHPKACEATIKYCLENLVNYGK